MIPVGLVLAEAPAPGGWASLPTVAAEAEAAGAASLWVTDHLFWHRPTPDPIAALTMMAMATSTCLLGPLVLQLPLRTPASAAKSLSFVDHLSGGRVVAGLGVGERPEEYERAGFGDRYRRRGRLLDAGMAELRAYWSENSTMAPARPLPMWVGGRSPAAIERAVRLGDGWMPHLCPIDWYRSRRPMLDAALDAADRGDRPFTRGAAMAIHVDGVEPEGSPTDWLGRLYALPPAVFDHGLLRGSPSQVAAGLVAFAEAGVEHVVVIVAGDRPVDHLAPVLEALRG